MDAKSDSGSSVYGGRRLEQALVQVPEDISLDEFKHQVKMWMDIDNQIKKMQQHIKEKRNVQKLLSTKILEFMGKYNIEDLNTKEGMLRYKVTQTKPPVKKKMVQQKLLNYFEHDKEAGEKLVKAVFEDTLEKPVEKVTLRRLKGVRVMNV